MAHLLLSGVGCGRAKETSLLRERCIEHTLAEEKKVETKEADWKSTSVRKPQKSARD